MEAEDIKTLVNLQLEKAHRFLDQADEMYSMKYWDLAANRYYYACYHAVQGLFIAVDFLPLRNILEQSPNSAFTL